jgi:hypothetical protein
MVRREWYDGSWFLMIPTPKDPAAGGGLWLRYEDLCAAFPGFKEIYTPEPDEPLEDGQ